MYDNFDRLGNQKYMPQMVPGYTGYVPKALNHFGNRYAESCHFAITKFKYSQDEYHKKMEEMKKCNHLQSSTVPSTPLKPIATKPKAYLPMIAKHHSISPFHMPDGHPQKYLMSGYTGFVPKKQKYIGQGYPIITHHALKEHSQDCKRLEDSLKAPVALDRPVKVVKQVPLLYKKGQGLLPRYTGHIPGTVFGM